jgi:cysteine synthase
VLQFIDVDYLVVAGGGGGGAVCGVVRTLEEVEQVVIEHLFQAEQKLQ